MLNLSHIDTRNFSKSDHMILFYISTHEHDLLFSTSEELATKINVSSATISRFWRKLGFNTIKEFRQVYLEQQGTQPDRKVKNTLASLTQGSFNVHDIFQSVSYQVEKTLTLNSNGSIELAASMIVHKKVIYGFAPDVSLGAFEVLHFRLRRFGIELIRIPQGSEIYDTLMNIQKQHTVLVFCLSRVTKEMEILFQEKESRGYKLILITDLINESIPYPNDCELKAYRGKKQEYHTLASVITLVDCLVLAVAAMNQHTIKNIEKLTTLRDKYAHLLTR